MKRFVVESIVLLAIAMVARFIAGTGDPALAMFLLAAYAAVLIYLSQEERFKRENDSKALRRRLADMTARERRLEEALVGASCVALWVINLPNTETDADAPTASEKG